MRTRLLRTIRLVSALLAGGATANELSLFDTQADTDMAVFGEDGLRGIGTGVVEVVGVGDVRRALLYWHGPMEGTNDPTRNAAIQFDGQSVTGEVIGLSSPNCWEEYDLSVAYRADVTALVPGDGTYPLADMRKPGPPPAEANGASLIVFHQDGDPDNNIDALMFDGNDSNAGGAHDPDFWRATLAGLVHTGGAAEIVLHVSDGQNFGGNEELLLDDQTLLPPSHIEFNGASLGGGGSSAQHSGGMWDIVRRDLGPFLSAGTNTLRLSSELKGDDCFSLIQVTLTVPAARAPVVTNSTIAGVSFHDADRDGVQDCTGLVAVCEEIGIGGIVVFLDLDRDGALDPNEPRRTTDAFGLYTFEGLAAGDYAVREIVPPGLISTAPTGDVRMVSVAENATALAHFGNLHTGAIMGVVWNDLNANGDDNDENLNTLGLAGVGVDVFRVVDGMALFLERVVSESAGAFAVSNLPPGTYGLALDNRGVPESLDQRSTPTNALRVVELGGGPAAPVLFGAYELGDAIRLVQFTAVGPRLTWITGMEADTLGFLLERAAAPEGPWIQIDHPLILATGGGLGATYTIDDPAPPADGPAFYRLVEIDTGLRRVPQTAILAATPRPPVPGATLVVDIDAGQLPVRFESGGADNIMITGAGARATVVDLTEPDRPVRPEGARLTTEAGRDAHYFSTPPQRTYLVE